MITTIEKTITASRLDYVEELVRRAAAREPLSHFYPLIIHYDHLKENVVLLQNLF